MTALLQVFGALLVLGAFVCAQAKVLDPHSVLYLLLNCAGSGLLAVMAAISAQWGFLLLESTWAVASAVSLKRALA
jgi:hypothetical protein